MADKRKDSRGIVLQQGESQNAAGRYRYRYFDDMGLPHDVYSWRLRPEDPVPEGKKPGASLRELEKEIQKDRLDGVKTWEDITVNKLMQEYIEQQKPYWRANTLNSKMDTYKNHIKDTFGRKKVSKVTPDSVENFYNELLNRRERPIKMGTLELVNTLLNATFKLAVKRNLIRNNPVTGCLGIVKKKNRIENSKKHALEEKQQRALLEFMRNSPKYMQYYPLFYILAWTGCRIGELLGLTWYDLDFKEEIIHINHELSYTKVDGRHKFILGEPKTARGKREIPMLGDVKEILLQRRDFAGWSKVVSVGDPKVSIEDTRPFVFLNSNNNLIPRTTMEHLLKKIVKEYNKSTGENLIDITPHTFRHSFCCWLCENVSGENSMDDVKYIQSIMGHADARTTLNIYSELRKGNAKSKHEALKAKAQI